MLVQTDFDIIMKKLDKFEEDLKKLENEVKVLNAYVDTQLKNKYYAQSQAPADLSKAVRPIGAIGYVLEQGDLANAGFKQQWRVATENEDIEE